MGRDTKQNLREPLSHSEQLLLLLLWLVVDDNIQTDAFMLQCYIFGIILYFYKFDIDFV